jgi:hypothetical protein
MAEEKRQQEAAASPIDFLLGDYDEKFRQMKRGVFDAQVKHKILTKLGVEKNQKSEQP